MAPCCILTIKALKKTFATTSARPFFFSYMEHPLKPLQRIEEVVVEVFWSNFVTLKTSARRCSPCSDIFEHIMNHNLIFVPLVPCDVL
jgi:hypothetical protein